MSGSILRMQIILIHCLLSLSCNQGQVEFDNQCYDCSSNCQSCIVLETCITCNPGYRLDFSFQCITCSNGCEVCNLMGCQTCFPKFYKSGSKCNACPTQCATCTSNSVCQTCVDNYYINGSSCSTCYSSCKTCTNTSNNCTSCYNGKFLSGSKCEVCVAPCSNCINNSNDCTTCIDNNQQVINYRCVCNNGYYMNGLNQCQLCNSPCSQCEFNANNCIDCISTFTLSLSQPNICECSFGYFQLDYQTCQKCQSPCLSCIQNMNHCLTCVDQNQQVNQQNICICKIGWILNIDGITCIQCQLPCVDCIQTINKCISCQDQSHQQTDQCVCQSGWIYDNNYFCVPCLEPCKTCEISTSKCLSCLDDNHIINNQSQCICKSKFYSNSLTTCLKCNEPCYECNLNGCINCIDPNQILNTNYDCVCKPGYILQGINCYQCQLPCSTCINNIYDCLTCIDVNQTVINYQCLCKEGFKKIGNICCDQYCIDCQENNNCILCIKSFYLTTNNRCLKCIEHCDTCYNQINCQICQDGYFINQQSLCQECINYCKTCSNQSNCIFCYDGYYISEQKCEQCSQNCLTCNEQAEKCITCKPEYQINNYNQCVCQDGYYQKQNQCLRCLYPCKTCLNNFICYECISLSNLSLNQNFECQCSSGYFWNKINCSQCNKSCQTCIDNQFNCLNCNQGQHRVLIDNKCLCNQNYYENEFGICISCLDDSAKSQVKCQYENCNDSIWTYGEECDDGNNVNRDGCSNCKIDQNYSCYNEILKQSICFECSSNCIKCQLNTSTNKQLCTKCKNGYFLDKNDCVKCSKNCLECIDQPYNCISCKLTSKNNNKCQICQSQQGYYENDLDGHCLPKCGDYIKVIEEECDDGNLIKGDGCNDECKLEQQYIFIKDVSIIPIYPQPQLQNVGNQDIYQIFRLFKLFYNSQIVIIDDFQIKDYLSFHISNQSGVQQIDQKLKLIQDILKFNELNQSQLILNINITFSRSSQDEILLVRFSNTSVIYSSDGYSQVETELSCSIPKIIYIDDTTIKQVQLTTQSNIYILYFIGALCAGSILFGGIQVFYNLLDTLQMLSYLKFINTQLPFNLQMYFELFGFVQINFIQKIFDLQEIIDLILYQNHFKKIPTKIAKENLTSLFIINASSIITVWISLFIIYQFAKAIPKFFYKIKFKFYSESETENQWLIKLGVYYLAFKYFINNLCYIIISELFYSGMLRVYMATAYDFTFSIVLQLYALELQSPNIFISFSSFLACIGSAIYLFSIYYVIQLLQMKKYSFKNKTIQKRYGSVFEGIKLDQFSKYFNVILLIKKLIFMIILIFAYEFPIFQIGGITFLSISMSLYLFKFLQLSDKSEYFKQLISEINISLTLLGLTILVYDLEMGYFKYQTRQFIGWVCIILMTSILCIQLGIDSFQQWKFLYHSYKQLRRVVEVIFGIFQKKNQSGSPSNIFQ